MASKIEAELSKATDIVFKKGEDRQDFLNRLSMRALDLPGDDWDNLSDPATEWVNAATAAFNGKQAIPEFEAPGADAKGEVPEKPAAAAKSTPAKTRGRPDPKAAKEAAPVKAADKKAAPKGRPAQDKAPEAKDGKPAAKPAPAKEAAPIKKGAAAKPAIAAKEAKAPAKKTPAKAAPAVRKEREEGMAKHAPLIQRGKPGRFEDGIKYRAKKFVITHPKASVDDLVDHLGKGGEPISRLTSSEVRRECRHTIKVLKSLGHLADIDI